MRLKLLKKRKYPHILLIIVPILGLTISILLFLFVRNLEQQNINLEFRRIANDRFAAIEGALDANIQVLEALRAFYAASENVERDEFKKFTQPLLSHYPAIHTLKWAPKVTVAERTRLEKAFRENMDSQISRLLKGVPAVKSSLQVAMKNIFPYYIFNRTIVVS